MGIVEESVVAVPPRVGLRADAEMVVRDELGALMVARVQPGVEGAEGHARERQHEGQEAPGASSCSSVVSLGCARQAPTQGPQRHSHHGERSSDRHHCPLTPLYRDLASPPLFLGQSPVESITRVAIFRGFLYLK